MAAPRRGTISSPQDKQKEPKRDAAGMTEWQKLMKNRAISMDDNIEGFLESQLKSAREQELDRKLSKEQRKENNNFALRTNSTLSDILNNAENIEMLKGEAAKGNTLASTALVEFQKNSQIFNRVDKTLEEGGEVTRGLAFDAAESAGNVKKVFATLGSTGPFAANLGQLVEGIHATLADNKVDAANAKTQIALLNEIITANQAQLTKQLGKETVEELFFSVKKMEGYAGKDFSADSVYRKQSVKILEHLKKTDVGIKVGQETLVKLLEKQIHVGASDFQVMWKLTDNLMQTSRDGWTDMFLPGVGRMLNGIQLIWQDFKSFRKASIELGVFLRGKISEMFPTISRFFSTAITKSKEQMDAFRNFSLFSKKKAQDDTKAQDKSLKSQKDIVKGQEKSEGVLTKVLMWFAPFLGAILTIAWIAALVVFGVILAAILVEVIERIFPTFWPMVETGLKGLIEMFSSIFPAWMKKDDAGKQYVAPTRSDKQNQKSIEAGEGGFSRQGPGYIRGQRKHGLNATKGTMTPVDISPNTTGTGAGTTGASPTTSGVSSQPGSQPPGLFASTDFALAFTNKDGLGVG